MSGQSANLSREESKRMQKVAQTCSAPKAGKPIIQEKPSTKK